MTSEGQQQPGSDGVEQKKKKPIPQPTYDFTKEKKSLTERLLEPGQVQSYQDIMGELPDTPRVDLSDILEARKKGLGGYTSEESAALRSQMAGQLARQGQAQQRQLLAAQAKAGVRGGAAASQGQRLIQNIGAQRVAGEQELFIKNIAEQQRRQQQYEELIKSQRMANLAAEITRQQIAQAEREAQRAQEAAKIPAAAQVESSKGGCCSIIAISSSLLGLNAAEASQFAELTKLPESKLVVILDKKELQAARTLNKTRYTRDHFCSDKEKRGYYVLSERFAETVGKSVVLSNALNAAMVKPLAELAEKKPNFILATIGKAWIKFFGLFGSDRPFTRSNGEIV